MTDPLSNNHWTVKQFTQRMTRAEWRRVLLDGNDEIIYCGQVTKLVAKDLGYGVVEVTKDQGPSAEAAKEKP